MDQFRPAEDFPTAEDVVEVEVGVQLIAVKQVAATKPVKNPEARLLNERNVQTS